MNRKSDASLLSRYGEKFAELLPQLRREAGLTQEELAQRMGRIQSLIGKIETKERRVNIDEFSKIAEALGRDAAKLFAQLHRAVLKDEAARENPREAR